MFLLNKEIRGSCFPSGIGNPYGSNHSEKVKNAIKWAIVCISEAFP